MPRRKIILIFLSFVCGICLFSLFSLELYSRYKYFNGTKLSDKGFLWREGYRSLKKTTPLRIVCVGDSTTWGSYVRKDEAYPALLEEILNRKYGTRLVEVQNSGMPSTHTEFHRNYIKRHINEEDLDILVVNSFFVQFESFFPMYYDPAKDTTFVDDQRWNCSIRYNWKCFNLSEAVSYLVAKHCYSYPRIREKLFLLTHGNGPNALKGLYKVPGESGAKDPKKTFIVKVPDIKYYDVSTEEKRHKTLVHFLKGYYDAIQDIIDTARLRDVKVVLVMPPYPVLKYGLNPGVLSYNNVSDTYFREVFDKCKKILIAVSEDRGVVFVDADAGFKRYSRRDDLFIDAVHLSPEGNRLMAQLIADKIGPYISKKVKSSRQ